MSAPAARHSRVFVVVNPAAGAGLSAAVQRALETLFPPGACEFHETTPDAELPPIVRGAVERGANLVVAGGGDGTVSAVANGLIGSLIPLGIIPVGTANVLARELQIPLDLDGACQLLAASHA